MNIRRYFCFLGVHLASQMEYRISFIMSFAARALGIGIQYISAYFLILKFQGNTEFSYSEVVICFLTVNIGMTLAEFFFRGFDLFSYLVKSGIYDRILLRPQNVITQILEMQMGTAKLGGVIQCLIILAMTVPGCGILWTPDRIVLFILMIGGAFLIYSGIFILGAAVCFYTTEGIEVLNILSYGTQSYGVFPYRALGKRILTFLTFILPLALVQEYPMGYITGRTDNPLTFLMPAASILFFLITLKVFHVCSRRYVSIGS